jgi:hypothetical protein
MGEKTPDKGQEQFQRQQMTEQMNAKKAAPIGAKSNQEAAGGKLASEFMETAEKTIKSMTETLFGKLLNPIMWYITAVNLTRPFYVQVDETAENGYMKFANLFR